MPQSLDLDRTYRVGGQIVSIQVIIGQAQSGATLASLNNGPRFELPNGQEVALGTGLAGMKLAVRSMVTDTNPDTNNMSVTYVLRGGQRTLRETVNKAVEAEADSEVFRADFSFTGASNNA